MGKKHPVCCPKNSRAGCSFILWCVIKQHAVTDVLLMLPVAANVIVVNRYGRTGMIMLKV